MMTNNDAVSGNFNKVSKQVSQAVEGEKQSYKLIVEKYIDEAFAVGVREAELELSLEANSLYDFEKTKSTRDVLKKNAVSINWELFDAIEKEITLFLTNVELNNIPFTSAGIKKEVQKIFDKKRGRLASQIVTETTRSTNVALDWGYKKSGIVTHKQWVAIIDNKTTSICLNGNGEVREIGQPFSSGDYTAPFHINCRSRTQAITLSEQ